MQRVVIKCKICDKILGYMSVPQLVGKIEPNELNGVMAYGQYEPICCPTCEVKRLMEHTKHQGD